MVAKKKTVHEKVIREVIEKPAKKKRVKRKSPRKTTSKKSESDKRIENALIENFISLQKVMVNLSVKFDSLSTQISKLLELFEISAKALAEKEFVTDKEKKDNHEVVQKMDEILDQNKILARGLTLMHDRITEDGGIPISNLSSSQNPSMQVPLPRMPPRPLPSMRPRMPVQRLPSMSDDSQNTPNDTYQKSISSQDNEPKSHI